jgi:poly(3-hydroxybutyrate) depolymerase
METMQRMAGMTFHHASASLKVQAVFFLAWLVAGCSQAATAFSGSCVPGSYDEEISSGGQPRQFRLHIPPGYQASQHVALVLGFHGAGMTGPGFESMSGFSALSDQASFTAAYPQGLGSDITNWDTMPNSADVPFVRDLIDSLTT